MVAAREPLVDHLARAISDPMGRALRTLAMLPVKFVYLGTFPVWAPILIVVMCFELHLIPGELRLKRQMRSKRRYSSPTQLRGRTTTGTLILDFPTFSWAIWRVWYTPDDVMAHAPVPPPNDGGTFSQRTPPDRFEWHPFHRWCWDRYLSPESGSALLIGVWHSKRLAEKLAVELRLPLVHSYSGGQSFERIMRRFRLQKGTDSKGDDEDSRFTN
jgi:hypothetical protein